MADTYKVNVPVGESLGVLKAISTYTDEAGNVTGYEHQSVPYYDGETVPRGEISPVILDALDEADENNPIYAGLKDRLVPADGESAVNTQIRLGVPFADYDALSEDEVVDALRLLSGPVIAAVKEHEFNGLKREKILLYNAGTREGVTDRIEGNLSADLAPADPKPTATRVTRAVGESSVEPGEGWTGSDPARTLAETPENAAPGAPTAEVEPSGVFGVESADADAADPEVKVAGPEDSQPTGTPVRETGGDPEVQNPDSTRDGA